jgi:hypothetical protein
MDIIYTDFRSNRLFFEKLFSADVLRAFSLKNLPIETKHLREYDYNGADEEELLNRLLETQSLLGENNVCWREGGGG